MSAIDVQQDYPFSADHVWQRIHGFGDLQSWLPGVTACQVEGEGVGAVRTVTVADGSQVREELVAFDTTRRQFSYRILKGPGVDQRANFVATVSVAETRGGCSMRWQADFNAGNAPPENVEKARQSATGMYRFCLTHLGQLLAQEAQDE